MDPDETFGRGGLNGFVDVDELVADLGLDESEIAWRKDFIGFDEADAKRLADLEPLLRDNKNEIADDFYDKLLTYDQTRAVIDWSPKGIDALKETQSAYLVSLATGEYDRDYFANRARIGKLHELLDMPLKHYVGQYGVYYELLLDRLNERIQQQVVDAVEEWATDRDDETGRGLEGLADALGFGAGSAADDPALDASFESTLRDAIDDGMQDILALLRIINLDTQIAVETYVDSYAQRLERSIDRRHRLEQQVDKDVQRPLDELHEASEAVAEQAEAISQYGDEQATAVTHAGGDLDEISAAVEEIASAADDVSAESDRTERLAADGVDAADDALSDLEAIESATERAASAADDLATRTEEIDAILERLDDLADRTTMLATNAKIESSRSGAEEQTLVVIANEVRSFAERTKTDIADIEDAVEAIREDAVTTVEATEQAADRVDTGADAIRDTVDSLEAIHDAAETTATGIDDVAAATERQARSVEATADQVDDLSETADRLAETAESLAAASQEQTASLQTVREAVARLTEEEHSREPPVYEQLA
ncbi:globin-coupled sensor protein [Halopiger aswanensis]|uniref:Methyl-accepting chemotaxis protein n=1 Tax=Halopiger aswanensis TaxID=148449 RepID=A0A3R7E0C1_9EURY|nr:globin-coupled sensor protein [Halopiger aswanensis]RKD95931.1 methyl-accepting chemotaxis protein [Halopiger aswanensis]